VRSRERTARIVPEGGLLKAYRCRWLTVTVVVHDACCCCCEASVALHVTVVVPTENFEPDVGEQELE
jgi:hypothetical protein